MGVAQWLWVSTGAALLVEGGFTSLLGLSGDAWLVDRLSLAGGEDSQSLPMMSVVLTS